MSGIRAAAVALTFVGLLAAANTRTELLRRLEGDLGRAMSNATLSEGQTKKLTQAREILAESAASKRPNDRYERNLLQSAVKDVQSAFKNKKAFRAADRQAVLDDLERIKKAGLLANAPARRARPVPVPRYPRRPPLSGAPRVR
jgi:hypothetical protein